MNSAITMIAGLAIAAASAGIAEAQTADLIFAAARVRTALPQTRAAAPMRRTMPVLNLTTGPETALAAAKAAKAKTVSTDPGDTVEPVTVRPELPREARVIASTDAASITSPNYTAADAAPAPLAISLGGASSLGKQRIDNRPRVGGLLSVNPELTGNPTRSDIGVTTLF